MRSIRKFTSSILSLVIISTFCAALSGCLEQKENTASSTKGLTVQEAKAIYDELFSLTTTKSPTDREKKNMFYRKFYEVRWETALPTRTDEVESVDVPVNEQRHYYVTTHDGQGFYMTDCHHSITIVKSVKEGATGVYHHFFIPFRDSRDKYRDDYAGDFYRGFYNNGYRDDFTGLELYSNSYGKVIKYLWYIKGKLVFSSFAGNGEESEKKIQQLLKYYIVKGYGILQDIHTKDGSFYICPQCGHELNEFNGYYYCSECDWNEMDFWEQYLEECYIYGEGGGSGGDDPEPNLPDQPDPNTGGGGGNNGTGSGNGGIDQGDIPANFHFNPNNMAIFFKPAIDKIMDDCAGMELFSILEGIDLNFEYLNGNLNGVIPGRRSDGNWVVSRILVGNDTITAPTLFEEMLHCVQIINQDYGNSWRLNMEVEAKFAAYRFANHANDENAIPHNAYYSALANYAADSSSTNYLQLIQYVRNIGDVHQPYANTTDFPESADHRHMNNIGSIFDCYEIE